MCISHANIGKYTIDNLLYVYAQYDINNKLKFLVFFCRIFVKKACNIIIITSAHREILTYQLRRAFADNACKVCTYISSFKGLKSSTGEAGLGHFVPSAAMMESHGKSRVISIFSNNRGLPFSNQNIYILLSCEET